MASLSSSKATVTEDQHAQHKRILKALLSDPSLGNKICADCHGRQPTWASVNLGVFVCLTCSGIHRSLGVHISQVRSTTLDTWTPDQVAFVQHVGGNTVCNRFWEAELDRHFVRPDGSNVHDLKRFIVDKYVNRRYVRHDIGEKVRYMSTDEFGRYYPGEILRQGVAEANPGATVRSKVHPSVPTATSVHTAAQPVVNEFLLLDVEGENPGLRETVAKTEQATKNSGGTAAREAEDDLWGDVEWVSGDAAPGETTNESEEQETIPTPAPHSTSNTKGKKSVDDILALFDA